jgi:cell division protein FtsB
MPEKDETSCSPTAAVTGTNSASAELDTDGGAADGDGDGDIGEVDSSETCQRCRKLEKENRRLKQQLHEAKQAATITLPNVGEQFEGMMRGFSGMLSVAGVASQLSAVQAENATLQARTGALEAENTRLQTRVQELETANAALRAELDQLVNAHAADQATLVNANAALRAEFDQLVNAHVADQATLVNANAALRAEFDQLVNAHTADRATLVKAQLVTCFQSKAARLCDPQWRTPAKRNKACFVKVGQLKDCSRRLDPVAKKNLARQLHAAGLIDSNNFNNINDMKVLISSLSEPRRPIAHPTEVQLTNEQVRAIAYADTDPEVRGLYDVCLWLTAQPNVNDSAVLNIPR